jgi:hypothetical protein
MLVAVLWLVALIARNAAANMDLLSRTFSNVQPSSHTLPLSLLSRYDHASTMSTDAMNSNVLPTSVEAPNTASTWYSPLMHDGDSFRLLRVLPSPITILPIRCELYTASISREEDKYIAGSYVWGPPEPSQSIILNGEPFKVRRNLFRFLQAFRSWYRSQIIWIDAICINQDDIQERGHQVQEMKRIYSGAKCVYCWLGLDSSIPYTSMFGLHHAQDLFHWRSRDKRQRMRTTIQGQYLAQAEYWSRIWIVQEFLLARDLILLVGNSKISYRMFESIMNVRHPLDFSRTIFDGSAQSLVEFRQGGRVRDFETIFRNFGRLLCSVPQDAVFGLLGLIGEQTRDLELIAMIDYSLTIWQLLHSILASNVLRDPLGFTEHYNRSVIKGQKDRYMHDCVNMELQYRSDWPFYGSDDSRYADLDGSCLRMALALPSDGLSIPPYCKIVFAVYTRDRQMVPERPCVLLLLSPHGLIYPGMSIIAEACDSRCSTTCAFHRILGLEWELNEWGEWLSQSIRYEPAKLIDLPLFMYNYDITFRRIILALRQEFARILQTTSLNSRVVKNKDGQYILETKLQTVVELSDFVRTVWMDWKCLYNPRSVIKLSKFARDVAKDWPRVQSEAQ